MGWQEFCDDHRITYRPGSGKDNIEVQCPMCGFDDQSMHMGLSLDSSKYGCWRDEEHRGISPTRLIKELVKCNWKEAAVLASEYFQWHHANEPAPVRDVNPVEPPDDFFDFGTEEQLEKQFTAYLKHRGYDATQIIRRYQIKWCVTGRFAHRLIIPVIRNSRWYTWVGRTIDRTEELRYLAGNDKDGCTIKPADLLFDQDNLTGGKLLLVCEGAFDAMKVNSAFIFGVQATALFGQTLSPKQLIALQQLAPKFQQIAIALDKEAFKHSVSMRDRLSWYAPNVCIITPQAKDWGDMPLTQIKEEVAAYAT